MTKALTKLISLDCRVFTVSLRENAVLMRALLLWLKRFERDDCMPVMS